MDLRFVDLESSSVHQQKHHIQFNHHPSEHHKNEMGSGVDDFHHQHQIDLTEVTPKGFSMNFFKGKGHYPNIDGDDLSEDDGHGENLNGTPWQRMKWTDEIVKLLISVVACVGDDGNNECNEGSNKRKPGKGKWKTVSKIMISKGCHVSPQQCEDKFNDLNKRYEKLNGILGRGTSCKVVENPSLMDSMPHLSAKAKDVVKKILSSKHLFYKEICAYHNGQTIPNCHDLDLPKGHAERCSSDESDKDDDSNDVDGKETSGPHKQRRVNEDDFDFWPLYSRRSSFEIEMGEIFQDPNKSSSERKEWIRKKMLQLQEERFDLQAQSFEIEKQWFKWLGYCAKKNKELERLRLENQQMLLETESAAFQIKLKTAEINSMISEASEEIKLI